MSIYKEALVEAKKLKETAEQDAKKAIIEDITPAIRKLIASELAGKTNPLFEEDDKMVVPVDATASPPAPPGDAVVDSPVIPASVVGGPMDAPIKVTGADALNMPLPGPDGKLVIDFDDLFVPAEPGEEISDEGPGSASAPPEVPGGLPSPAPVDVNPSGSAGTAAPISASPASSEAELEQEEEPMEETYALFAEALEKTARKIHMAYSLKTGVPSLVKEALQEQLFQLLETLENLSAKKLVSERLQKISENRLEILHCKLKEAVVVNTYFRTESTKAMATKSLKEMAAKMLAESETLPGGPVTSPADVHKTQKSMKVDNAEEAAADKAGLHAMKVSEPHVTLKTESAALAALEEELAALVAEDSGDSLSTEPGKQDLVGAASSIPNKKVDKVDPETSHVLSVSAKALDEQTKKMKAKALKKKIAALQEELKECVAMENDSTDSADTKSMMRDDVVVNFNFDLADLVPELDKLGDEDEIEISDEDEDVDVDLDVDADEDESDLSVLDWEESEEDHEDDAEEKEEPLKEAIRRGRGPATRKALNENQILKAKLAQETLFNAKVVHFQPFLNNKNLTKEQKQKIVEHLDRGTSVAEIKVIYNRLKTVLENIQKAKEKAGSSSKAGAAISGVKLNEEANPYEGSVLVDAERNRLMELAGIKKRK